MTDDQGYLQKLLTEIKGETKQLALMEVCGTHTMAIARMMNTQPCQVSFNHSASRITAILTKA